MAAIGVVRAELVTHPVRVKAPGRARSNGLRRRGRHAGPDGAIGVGVHGLSGIAGIAARHAAAAVKAVVNLASVIALVVHLHLAATFVLAATARELVDQPYEPLGVVAAVVVIVQVRVAPGAAGRAVRES